MELEIILGIACVILLGATFMLSMGRLEKLQQLRGLEGELTEARRGTQNATKKLEDHQSRYDKISADLGRTQNQFKDLKKQHHNSREQIEQLKAGKRKSKVVDSNQSEARRAQARVEELEGELKAVRGKLDKVRSDHKNLKEGKEARLADQVAKIAGEAGGVSEDDVRRAVQDAERQTRKTISQELKDQHKEEMNGLRSRLDKARNEIKSLAIETRKMRRRYEDSQRAYTITQGQLEMAHDRIFVLEMGAHRRPHRPEAVMAAEMAYNAQSQEEAPKSKKRKSRKKKGTEKTEPTVATRVEDIPEEAFTAKDEAPVVEKAPPAEEAVPEETAVEAPAEEATEEAPVEEAAEEASEEAAEEAPAEEATEEAPAEEAAEEAPAEEAAEEAPAEEEAAKEAPAEAPAEEAPAEEAAEEASEEAAEEAPAEEATEEASEEEETPSETDLQEKQEQMDAHAARREELRKKLFGK